LKQIDFEAGLGMTNSDVYRFGPLSYDSETGDNYIYWEGSNDGGLNGNSRYFFGKMNSNARIYQYNRVDEEDVILIGSPLVLSL
jgi:hypothetical protein